MAVCLHRPGEVEARAGEGPRSPLQVALDWVDDDHRGYEREVVAAVGDVLVEQHSFDAAFEVFEALQTEPRWRLHPDNPAIQQR